MRYLLGEAGSLCREYGADLTVVLIPHATSAYLETAHAIALEEMSGDVPFRFVDLAPHMLENRPRLYIGNGDVHWTAEGHRVAAERLARLWTDDEE